MAENDYWEKLLHLDNNTSNIISENFYLSDTKNITAREELLLSINYINSHKGQNFACNFPARYLYLKKNYKVKKYSLKNCEELNNFYLDYDKKKLSLAFASEYTNNPSSVFGHTMLILHNDYNDLEVGDVIHFFAHTNEEDRFFKYIVNGITGKYESYYGTDKFFKKLYRYNTLQQRYIYVYTLDFSEEEIKKFLYHLYELRKAKYEYYFGTINCAKKIFDLLSLIKKPNQKKYNLFFLPIDVIKSFEEYIIDEYTYLPLLYKIQNLTENFENSDKILFDSILQGKEYEMENLPNQFKLALINKATFDFRFFRKVSKNYNKIMSLKYEDTTFIDKTINPINKIYPKNLTIGLENGDLIFNYNTVGKYINDLSSDFTIQDTEVRALNVGFSTSNNLKIRNFDFVSINSFPTINFYYKPNSYLLYSGFNRNNKKKQLRFVNEIGYGKTYFNFNIFKSTILFSSGNEDNKLFIKPRIIFSKQFNKIKCGIDYYKKYSDSAKDFVSYEYYIGKKTDHNYFLVKYSDNKFSINTRFSF
tara:strand:- start:606 stop:2204 length:1599 start_codon:yes stop_codon:yes gene_type:complete